MGTVKGMSASLLPALAPHLYPNWEGEQGLSSRDGTEPDGGEARALRQRRPGRGSGLISTLPAPGDPAEVSSSPGSLS